MNSLIEFDELLSDESVTMDGWNDYLEEVAKSKIEGFTEEEWNAVYSLWITKKEDWQVKLAGVLGSYNPGKTVPLLEEMTRQANPKVVAEALYSLEGMDGDEYLYIPSVEMKDRLENIYTNVQSPILRETIESLQARMT